MRIFVIIAFIGILGSLGSALFYLMRDKGTSNKTVNALTVGGYFWGRLISPPGGAVM